VFSGLYTLLKYGTSCENENESVAIQIIKANMNFIIIFGKIMTEGKNFPPS
jgi:hypothetical protein